MGEFRCYLLVDGTDVIDGWLKDQPAEVRGEILAVLETLDTMSRDRWPESLFKELVDRPGSKCDGLMEIILKVGLVHYRILGFAGPKDDDFTMIYPFKKNDDPTYRRSCLEAHNRKAEVQRDWRRSHRCPFR